MKAPERTSPTGRRLVAAVVASVAVVAAFTLFSDTASRPPASTVPLVVPTLTTGATTTTEGPQGPRPFFAGGVGVLPDGTEFGIDGAAPAERLLEITGSFVVDLPDGSTRPAGMVWFDQPDGSEPTVTVQGNVFILPGPEASMATIGDWRMSLSIEPGVDDSGSPMSSIGLRQRYGFPVLTLPPPLRWATDVGEGQPMELRYEHFSVRKGCDDTLPGRCSQTRAVQVVTQGPGARDVFIESNAPRPVDDPLYLDPGPLSRRTAPAVVWTGDEMLVWGGVAADGQGLFSDGAAYRPDTGTWRPMTGGPFPTDSGTAVWTGSEMVVVGPRRDVGAYDPASDTWRSLGAPPVPLVTTSPAVAWFERRLWLWDGATVQTVDADGLWERLAAPTDGASDPLFRVADGVLYALWQTRTCSAKPVSQWGGGGWDLVDPLDRSTPNVRDCDPVSDTAVVANRLVGFAGPDNRSVVLDPATGSWSDIARMPGNGPCEGGARTVTMGTRLLVFPCGPALIYDVETDTWTEVPLQGFTASSPPVWTGSELLSWDGTRNPPDAWRWGG